MKKNPPDVWEWARYVKKILLMMRLTLFLVLFFISTASAFTQKVTLSVKSASLNEVLSQIKDQSGVRLLYNVGETRQILCKDIDINELDIAQALAKVLRDTPFEFVEKAGVFVVRIAELTQQRKMFRIAGKVVDEKGEPMPGVTVVLDSTTLGTSTDVNGKFVLNLPLNKGVLIISCVGYETKRVNFKYQEGEDIVIRMKQSVSTLDEAYVVAYGEASKREMTGSVSVVKADDIKGIPSPSISNLLQGRVAGMDVTNITGAPGGGGTNVTIRGYNSLSVESGRRFSNPLWVVDGVPMNSFTSPVTGTNGLSDLNPETIESIQVLKDASATSLYGSRAANGVIIVTTKKGRKNQDAQFDVNFSYSYNVLPAYPVQTRGKAERDFRLKQYANYSEAYYDEATGTYIYPDSMWEAFIKGENSWDKGVYDKFWGDGSVSDPTTNGNELQDSLNSYYNNCTNFFKYFFQASKTLNANIQTSGGSERMSYSIGLGYYNEEGILKGTGYKRANLMGNFSLNPVKQLTVDFRNYLSFSDRSRGVKKSGFSAGNEIETIPGDPFTMSSLLPGDSDVNEKALKGLQGTEEKNNSYRLRSTFGLKLDIIEGLNIMNTASLDYSQNNRNYFMPSWLDDKKRSRTNGEVGRDFMLLDELLVNFNRTFRDKHKLELMLGFSYQYDQSNYIGGEANNGPSDYVHYAPGDGWDDILMEGGNPRALKDYKSDFSEKKMASYFGRVNYIFAQKYMLTATLRRDGSSVFGRDVRWATFPSVAAAWNFSEEYFMKGLRWLDFGKVRFSYGISGNQFNQPYLAYGVLVGGLSAYEGGPVVHPEFREGYYNPRLGWEETSQYDLGLDVDMFNYRLSMTVDYYYRYTNKMLSKTALPGNYSGYVQAWRNAGALSNEGIEIELEYDIIRNEQAKWSISVNMAKNWNKLKKTYNGRDMMLTDMSENSRSYIIGKPVGSIVGYKTAGIIQSYDDVNYYYRLNGTLRALEKKYFSNVFYKPGDLMIQDINGDCYIGEEDEVYLGSSLPKLYGGIVNEVHWKNFDLNMLLSYSIGRDMINTAPVNSIGKDKDLFPVFENLDKSSFWEQAGDRADYPLIAKNNFNDTWSAVMDRYVEKVNYLKLKTLTVGYTLPRQWMKRCFIKDIRLFFSGENLLTFTNYSGLDPETVDINTGIDGGDNYPLARKLTMGITIKL